MSANNIELLHPVAHRDLRVNTSKYNVEQNQVNSSMVMLSELSSLVHEYPIFITKNTSTGQFQLTAILGFEQGENLYLQGDAWQATYLPLDILRRPFRVHLPEGEFDSGAKLAVDYASPLFQRKVGERIFDEQGAPTPYLDRIQQTFSQLMTGTTQTRNLLQQANELELLSPINLNIDLAEQGNIELNGLYTFDQEAITNLTGSKLKTCHQSGILQVCHLLLSSAIHLDKLIKFKRNKNMQKVG
ncbi:SapC family protein [Thalassotalea sp. PLHSN55]|uniref:SapC family protein n=1 Tax=Thalassotalea sp. PLHSN55 TaxID=3435888 RepID=UPI003F85816F